MKRKGILSILAVLTACLLLPGFALASASFDGTVVSRNAIAITAPFGGTVESVSVAEGDYVEAGDVLATVATTKVYASTDGEVTGVFAQVGDDVDNVVNRYGAALYITPSNKYTIDADTDYAYATSDNMYVHLGEVVYLRSYNFQIYNEGVGVITSVQDEDYTVETTEGEFWMGETVSIYRDADYDTTSRIGRGDVTRTDEVAVTDGGSIVAMYVQDGDEVVRGQLLYETVSGELEDLVADGNQIKSSVSGIVEAVSVSAGSNLEQGGLVATICPRDHMQIVIEVNEYDLMDIAVGDTVSLTFTYDDVGMSQGTGTVQMISDVSFSTDTSDVTYDVYIDFEAEDATRIGMTVMVDIIDQDEYTVEEDETAVAEDTAEDAAIEEQPADTEAAGDFAPGSMPSGDMPSGDAPSGDMPADTTNANGN
ncbi:MAG TPA: HlyD family efflux transporter periplasmic adaptor subunit [Candidatus Limiplasma sp.]|nr:HlyD family efflux transporter periplasmic adaptor subunit [Candidatus Limiplasma sp.]